MNQLFNFSFWFDVLPLPFMPAFLWGAIIVFGLGIVFSLVCIFFSKKSSGYILKKVWLKLHTWSLSFGLVGLLLAFLKEQRISYLGMRVWLVLWILICLVWLVFILKFVLLEIPKMKEEKRKQAEIKKYLP